MGLREKLEDRIKRKQQEITEYEAKIGEARAYIDGLQDALRLIPREAAEASGETSIRPGSRIHKTMLLLQREGKPMHVSDILRGIGIEPTKKERVSLSGSLGAYVRRQEVFHRPAPNVFGLIEAGADSPDETPNEMPAEQPNEQPNNQPDMVDDFGDINFGGDDIPF